MAIAQAPTGGPMTPRLISSLLPAGGSADVPAARPPRVARKPTPRRLRLHNG